MNIPKNSPPVDHVTASVIQGALENIAIEMGYKLMRMSYSSIIRESEDFGAGLVDTQGRGLAESAQSTPLQSSPIPGYVRGMQKILAERGETLRPGDVIMHNDPYTGVLVENGKLVLPQRNGLGVSLNSDQNHLK